jgi:hypothetical protein
MINEEVFAVPKWEVRGWASGLDTSDVAVFWVFMLARGRPRSGAMINRIVAGELTNR